MANPALPAFRITCAILAFLLSLTPVFGQGGGKGGKGEKTGTGSEGGRGSSGGDTARGGAAQGSSEKSKADLLDAFLASIASSGIGVADKVALRSVMLPALEEGVPLAAFEARIKEALAKGAKPAAFLAAITIDAANWRFTRTLFDDTWPPSDHAPKLYLEVGAALRNGFPREALRVYIAFAKASKAQAVRTGAVLTASFALGQRLKVDEALMERIAKAILVSSLGSERFGELAALASRAAAAGIPAQTFVLALEEVLASRGGLAELEKRLFG